MTSARAAPVKSPCTSVCKMDDRTGWCLGCMRTLDEIAGWSVLDEAAKRQVCESLDVRRAQFRVGRVKAG
jgi:predicted Fe-S protein YdhL (DUF1289 family)